MSLETEVAELREIVEKQHAVLNAVNGTMFSLLDLFSQVLETRGVADRSDVAGRLKEIVAKAKAETARTGSGLSDIQLQSQLIGHGLLEAFVDRLMSPASTPPPMPTLRVIK